MRFLYPERNQPITPRVSGSAIYMIYAWHPALVGDPAAKPDPQMPPGAHILLRRATASVQHYMAPTPRAKTGPRLKRSQRCQRLGSCLSSSAKLKFDTSHKPSLTIIFLWFSYGSYKYFSKPSKPRWLRRRSSPARHEVPTLRRHVQRGDARGVWQVDASWGVQQRLAGHVNVSIKLDQTSGFMWVWGFWAMNFGDLTRRNLKATQQSENLRDVLTQSFDAN